MIPDPEFERDILDELKLTDQQLEYWQEHFEKERESR